MIKASRGNYQNQLILKLTWQMKVIKYNKY